MTRFTQNIRFTQFSQEHATSERNSIGGSWAPREGCRGPRDPPPSPRYRTLVPGAAEPFLRGLWEPAEPAPGKTCQTLSDRSDIRGMCVKRDPSSNRQGGSSVKWDLMLQKFMPKSFFSLPAVGKHVCVSISFKNGRLKPVKRHFAWRGHTYIPHGLPLGGLFRKPGCDVCRSTHLECDFSYN